MWQGGPSYRSWVMIKVEVVALFLFLFFSGIAVGLKRASLIPQSYMVLAVIFFLVVAVLLVWLTQRSQRYMVTTRGVVAETGFLFRTKQREMTFRRIQMADVQQNILEKFILKTGAICLDSSASDWRHMQGDHNPGSARHGSWIWGKDTAEIVFSGIVNPKAVMRLIREGEDISYQPRAYQEPDPRFSAAPQAPPWEREQSGYIPPAPWDRSQDRSHQEPPQGPGY